MELSHQTCFLSNAPRVPATHTGVEKKTQKKLRIMKIKVLMPSPSTTASLEIRWRVRGDARELPDLSISKTLSVLAPARPS